MDNSLPNTLVNDNGSLYYTASESSTLEYCASQALDHLLNTSPPIQATVSYGCTPDICLYLENNIPSPRTLPTPPFLALWTPQNLGDPIEGIHYNQHPG